MCLSLMWNMQESRSYYGANNKNRNSTLDVFNLASQSNNSVVTQSNNLSRLSGKKEKLPPGSLMTIRHLK